MKENNMLIPALPTKKEPNTLQVLLCGNFAIVKRFWQFIRTAYRLPINYHWLFGHRSHKEKLHVVMHLEETPFPLSNPEKIETAIDLKLSNGNKITISPLDTQVVDMLNNITYIHGKSFDIFSPPSDTEFVDCIVLGQKEKA